MKEIEISQQQLKEKTDRHKYKPYITHYGNNLLNVLIMAHGLKHSDETNNSQETEPNNSQDIEIKEIKEDILLCIKDLELMLKDEKKLEYLKEQFHNWNYDAKAVLWGVKQFTEYFDKYYNL